MLGSLIAGEAYLDLFEDSDEGTERSEDDGREEQVLHSPPRPGLQPDRLCAAVVSRDSGRFASGSVHSSCEPAVTGQEGDPKGERRGKADRSNDSRQTRRSADLAPTN